MLSLLRSFGSHQRVTALATDLGSAEAEGPTGRVTKKLGGP